MRSARRSAALLLQKVTVTLKGQKKNTISAFALVRSFKAYFKALSTFLLHLAAVKLWH